MNGAGTSAQGIFQPLGDDDPSRIGGYRLAAKLGAGGMGKLYLSYTLGGRPVAIKVIRPEFADDPEFRRRFTQEVQAAERVQGLYTAPVIDSDTDGPQPWLATAYVSGPSLASAVAEHGPLPAHTVLLLIAGSAEALQVVHGAGIVHRDLKPSNVLLAADGPRVIDFGIARAADATALTSSGVTVGTPAFMSPEQAAGRTVGPQSDVFALGQVAAFAALGRSAHGDGPSHAVLYRIVHEDPDLTGLPAALNDLVRRCLLKDPDARPSLSEVLALCHSALDTTQLRRPEDWLPSALTTTVAEQYRPPSAPPRTPEPTTAAREPAPQSLPAPANIGTGNHNHLEATASAQQTQSLGHPPTVPVRPGQAPPQSGPAYASSQATTAHWPPQAGPSTWAPLPTGPGASRSGAALRRRIGIAVGAALGVLVFLCAALISYLDRDSNSGTNDDARQAGPVSTTSGSGNPSAQASGESPAADTPKPESHKNVNLPTGYYLKFSDQPLVPHESNYDDLYLSCGSGSDCDFGHYGTKLVLLDQNEHGSLDTCKRETRYLPQEVSVSRLSKGRQFCATTEDGLVALLTFVAQSPSTSASQYVTLNITIWRDAVPAQDD